MANKLTSEKVSEVFMDCLFSDGENHSDYVEAKGIVINVGFHPQRLESHKTEIEKLLGELPKEFQKSGGGGWSFLNACNDKNGNQWTGEQKVMEELFLLGIALGKVKFQLPREVWSALPGGVPYIVIDDE